VKQPSQEDLLGYVLGALDAPEERGLQQQIDTNPVIEEQLLEIRHSMAPLECLGFGDSGQRPGLARRTCELVANLKHQQQQCSEVPDTIGAFESGDDFLNQPSHDEQQVEPASATGSCGFSRFTDRFAHTRSWSRVDMLAGVAMAALFACILFPAISHSRYKSQIHSCQQNLREVGAAMLVYSDMHSGHFVNATDASSTCLLAPVLKDSGLIDDDSLFACAGRAEAEPPRIPTLQQIHTATGDQLESLKRRMGGDFGYSLGFFEGEEYFAPRNDGSSHTVLMADMPSSEMPGRSSKNHGGNGQNCFFADGRVEFISTHYIGDDAIYENDMGIVGPGVGDRDNVIAPSHLPAMRIKYELLSK